MYPNTHFSPNSWGLKEDWKHVCSCRYEANLFHTAVLAAFCISWIGREFMPGHIQLCPLHTGCTYAGAWHMDHATAFQNTSASEGMQDWSVSLFWDLFVPSIIVVRHYLAVKGGKEGILFCHCLTGLFCLIMKMDLKVLGLRQFQFETYSFQIGATFTIMVIRLLTFRS